MKIQVAVIASVLLLMQGGATAEEGEPCSSVACVLGPIYKMGRSIFAGEKEEAAPPSKPSDASGDQPARTDRDAISSQQSSESSAPKEAAQPGVEAPPEPRPSGSRSKIAARPRHKARTARVSRPAHKSPVAALATRRDDASTDDPQTVAVAASGPELARMLALASVVKSPTIRIVRAVNGPCRRKPEFVVDILQNVARLGPAIPLFSESLIILAGDGTSTIEELRGRSVSFGLPGSNSQQIGQRLFSSLKVDVRETPLDIDNSLDALSLGEVDAVALLVPSGYDRLARLDSRLHLISLGEGVVPPDGLKVTRIEPTTYLGGSWPSRKVGVITVDAVLSPNQDSPRDGAAISVYAALDRNAAALARSGFDLMGGDTLVTMRSVAKDVAPPPKLEAPAYPAFAQDGC